jgi:HEAT repeat protein/beta-lactamase regulating signal transducer with metallopeptidase domain
MTMPFLIETALKGTILLIGVALFALLPRRSSAAGRHFLWGLGLAGLLVLPPLSSALPWRLAVFPAPLLRNAEIPATTSPSNVEAPVPAAPAPSVPATSAAAATPTAPVASTHLSWSLILAGIWGLGTLLALARLAVGQWVVARIVRRSGLVADPQWHTELAAAARQLGVTGRVGLRCSGGAALPMSVGVLRPTVILPASAAGWTDARRRAVLVHELAHVKRRDLLTQLMARLACAAYWFHPLVWVAAHRLHAEGERACDDLVLMSGARPSDYAGHLLQLVRVAGPARAPALALPMAQRSDFEGRLLAILEPGVRRHPPTRRAAAFATLGVVSLLLPIAALSAAQARPSHHGAATNPPLASPSRHQAPARSGLHGLTPVLSDGAPVHVVAAELAGRRLVTPSASPVLAGTREQRMANPGVTRGLVAALSDADAEVRRNAAQSLGQREDTGAAVALAQALRTDADAGVRRTAAWALGQLESHEAVPALLSALRDDQDLDVRRTAVWALGQIEDAAAVDGLGAAVRDTDPEIRSKAVWALGQIESARAVPALTAALGDSSRDVRKQAAWALGQIESPDALDPLMNALHDANAGVREQAAWALGQIQSPRAAPALSAALSDPNGAVRKQAIWAIGQLDNLRQAPPGLLAALKDSDAGVRRSAAAALAQIEDPAAVPDLIVLLKDADVNVRRSAVQALAQFDDPKALDALVAALRDSDAEIRRAAAQALGRQ